MLGPHWQVDAASGGSDSILSNLLALLCEHNMRFLVHQSLNECVRQIDTGQKPAAQVRQMQKVPL